MVYMDILQNIGIKERILTNGAQCAPYGFSDTRLGTRITDIRDNPGLSIPYAAARETAFSNSACRSRNWAVSL